MKSGIAILLGTLALQNVASAQVVPNSASLSFDLGGMSVTVIDTDLEDGITPTFEWTSMNWYGEIFVYNNKEGGDYIQTEIFTGSSFPTEWNINYNDPYTSASINIDSTTATMSATSIDSQNLDPDFDGEIYVWLAFGAEYLITGKATVEFSTNYSIISSIDQSTNCGLELSCNTNSIDFFVQNWGNGYNEWGTEGYWSLYDPDYMIDSNFTQQISNKGDSLSGMFSASGMIYLGIAPTPVPEPGEWLMMLAGLAMLQLPLLRKHRQSEHRFDAN